MKKLQSFERYMNESSNYRLNESSLYEDVNYSSSIIKKFGIDISKIPMNSEKWYSFGTKKFNPNEFGIFVFVIKDLTIQIDGFRDENHIRLRLEYNYEHTEGGSNGYTSTIYSKDGGKTWLNSKEYKL